MILPGERVVMSNRIKTAAVVALLVAGVAGPVHDAGAADVTAVGLGTAGSFLVLGAETVTNTGDSTVQGSLGVWPGSSITGFPPGQVLAPGTIETTTDVAKLAQGALTPAYIDAAGRSIDATVAADLSDLVLPEGVYATDSKGALGLTGTLVLDAQGDPGAVWIFQTDSSLTTASGSTVSLVNGAQACNVFWQVGSSATLGSGSTMVGNVMAETSIFVQTAVTVEGRALARTGEVTLDNDTFVQPSCRTSSESTTTLGGGTTTPTGGRGIPGTGGTTDATAIIAVAALATGLALVLVARRPQSRRA